MVPPWPVLLLILKALKRERNLLLLHNRVLAPRVDAAGSAPLRWTHRAALVLMLHLLLLLLLQLSLRGQIIQLRLLLITVNRLFSNHVALTGFKPNC
jgi:hypothetical protein